MTPELRSPGLETAIVAGMVVTALFIGRDVFVPLTIAVLLSFVLAPAVLAMRRIHVPRPAAVLVVVVLAFGAIFAIGWAMTAQMTELAEELPRYQRTLKDKLSDFRGAARGGVVERATDALKDLGKELDKSQEVAGRATPPLGSSGRPIPVEIHQPEVKALETYQRVVGTLIHPLTTAGLVVIFVVFLLLSREDVRDRIIRLLGAHDIQRTTAAMNDAAGRLSRFFLMHTALNGAFGLVIGLGLWLIGVPAPILWGIIAMLMRYVPYIGSVIAAAFPLALAAAVDPGWSMVAATLALYLVAEPVAGHVIEPWLFGQSTGLSPLAIVVSASFWTLLWGPIGLLLATPLTVCLVVLGRHVEALRFLDVMLGDEPPLRPEQMFYQRTLADDPEEVVEQAEDLLKARSLSAYYDEVALKGLQLAQIDASRGALIPEQLARINETVGEIIEDLEDHEDRTPVAKGADGRPRAAADNAPIAPGATSPSAPVGDDRPEPDLPALTAEDLAPDWRGAAPILCVAGRSPLDEAAAALLAQLLGKHGLGARVVTFGRNPPATPADGPVRLVCFSHVSGGSRPVHLRTIVRRLRRQMPGVRLLVGLWLQEGEDDALQRLKDAVGADDVATSFRAVIEVCLAAARHDVAAATIAVAPLPLPQVVQ